MRGPISTYLIYFKSNGLVRLFNNSTNRNSCEDLGSHLLNPAVKKRWFLGPRWEEEMVEVGKEVVKSGHFYSPAANSPKNTRAAFKSSFLSPHGPFQNFPLSLWKSQCISHKYSLPIQKHKHPELKQMIFLPIELNPQAPNWHTPSSGALTSSPVVKQAQGNCYTTTLKYLQSYTCILSL